MSNAFSHLGIVTSPNAIASESGAAVLREGGTAVEDHKARSWDIPVSS